MVLANVTVSSRAGICAGILFLAAVPVSVGNARAQAPPPEFLKAAEAEEVTQTKESGETITPAEALPSAATPAQQTWRQNSNSAEGVRQDRSPAATIADGLLNPQCPPYGAAMENCHPKKQHRPCLGHRWFSDCGCGRGLPCYPGREPCPSCCGQDDCLARFFSGLYRCICCPDPCYEPHWIPLADAAFFTKTARPVTQTQLGWDFGRRMILPDRSEYFWARADGGGEGPRPIPPALAVPRLDYHQLWFYQEVAIERFGLSVRAPYREIDPDAATVHSAGFSDIRVAAKAMLFDCELLQVAFQFAADLPTGNADRGLGTNHTSLEPSFMFGLKLHKDAYLQAQVSEWIPIDGDEDYAGSLLHYHASFNRVLLRVRPNVPLVGTAEATGFTFHDGAYTDPVLGPFQRSSGDSYLYAGGGLRLFFCNTIDFGVGFLQSVTSERFADQIYRTELRWRY